MHQTDSTNPGKIWLSAAQVRARYGGVSDMAIWRWLRRPEMGFPKPVYINKRRYWREDELDAFDAAQTSETEAA